MVINSYSLITFIIIYVLLGRLRAATLGVARMRAKSKSKSKQAQGRRGVQAFYSAGLQPASVTPDQVAELLDEFARTHGRQVIRDTDPTIGDTTTYQSSYSGVVAMRAGLRQACIDAGRSGSEFFGCVSEASQQAMATQWTALSCPSIHKVTLRWPSTKVTMQFPRRLCPIRSCLGFWITLTTRSPSTWRLFTNMIHLVFDTYMTRMC